MKKKRKIKKRENTKTTQKKHDMPGMQEKKTDMRKNHMTHDMPRTKIVSAGVSCFSWNSLGVRNLGAYIYVCIYVSVCQKKKAVTLIKKTVRNLGALKFLSFSFPRFLHSKYTIFTTRRRRGKGLEILVLFFPAAQVLVLNLSLKLGNAVHRR